MPISLSFLAAMMPDAPAPTMATRNFLTLPIPGPSGISRQYRFFISQYEDRRARSMRFQPIAKVLLLDFSGRRHRELIDQNDAARNLVARQFSATEIDHFLRIYHDPNPSNHERNCDLVQSGVRTSHDRDLR